MIVLDANVLIGHLDHHDAHHARATERLLAAAGDTLGTSTVTLAEALVGPTRAGTLADARAALRRLCITELSLPGHAAERLAALRAQTGLRLPDCCVLLAAEQSRGSVLSFDDRLTRAADQLGLSA